jgi:hypothetical protein
MASALLFSSTLMADDTLMVDNNNLMSVDDT